MIDTINKKEVRITANLLKLKILWKNIPNQCTSRIITSTNQSATGIQMNWSLFLLNEIMEDVVLTQETSKPFTYS